MNIKIEDKKDVFGKPVKTEYTIRKEPEINWCLNYYKDSALHLAAFEKAPNVFHRMMQRVFFGFVWTKL